MTRRLRSIALVALAAPVFLLGACGRLSSPGASQAVVRPIGEILVDAPQIEAGETSATVTATTRIPVACAVAYGTTHEYGSLAPGRPSTSIASTTESASARATPSPLVPSLATWRRLPSGSSTDNNPTGRLPSGRSLQSRCKGVPNMYPPRYVS